MSDSLWFTVDNNIELQQGVLSRLDIELGNVLIRHFPDGESYVRVESDCRDRDIIIQCTLTEPDARILPLFFLADTARELGARSVGLVAPYLAYMRQDKRFQVGESISSRLFAQYLSARFDWLLTVDPHLHRFHTLEDLYGIPCRVIHAAPALTSYIAQAIPNALLIGPDSESEQWVSAIAKMGDMPYQVLQKERRGDRDVSVSIPETSRWKHHTPVLIDDMISTGQTLIETIGHLKSAGLNAPICVSVHGLFSESADVRIMAAGAARIVTTNSIVHRTNAIDLAPLIAEALPTMLPVHRGA
ncbi:ribose-phosphate pyrophosphokinase [Permianibacter aggregans]|uniref:Ribose-phosphate pyrophosphokinase n=1 Tax=Permianibacter aggregans TaxID=1510150 RepID=A0A4R6UIW9_9GAMM|nr:ribose-phosphate pyrophosphokinase [Permianibacter aggregans]QGX38177.1 ribose-phosphate pyrophosphokinase [Permianibacter aggregans]TDQ44975.1 ribose-phosphate pyrophosphokinase [Permianibacter aggregans]